ncbi:hypothetical protein [Bacillus sp. FSL R5-0434]|uniref:hypothetical protein n=1 Tax=Bacillus sp. FSL R5-0434 TaxID=2975301 RepID=UPI0030F4F445
MIEITTGDYSWFHAVTITQTETGIEISEGVLRHGEDVYPLEAISFDLTPDTNYNVQYDLYLLLNSELNTASYQLHKAYLDGESFCNYEGDERLIHTVMSITVSPTGERSGSMLICEKKENENEA